MRSFSSLLPSGHDPIVHIANNSNPFDDVVREQLQDRVAAAVAELPPGIRLPLVLAEIAELPLKDVARVLGLKLGTVKSRVHRARLAVRARIAAELPSRPPPATDRHGRFCLDLLHAKQEALDRGVSFLVRDGDLCERCRSLFATLDLAHDVCRLLANGKIPPEVATMARAGLTPTPLRRPPRKTAPRPRRS